MGGVAVNAPGVVPSEGGMQGYVVASGGAKVVGVKVGPAGVEGVVGLGWVVWVVWRSLVGGR